jgi:hypothetical protein
MGDTRKMKRFQPNISVINAMTKAKKAPCDFHTFFVGLRNGNKARKASTITIFKTIKPEIPKCSWIQPIVTGAP